MSRAMQSWRLVPVAVIAGLLAYVICAVPMIAALVSIGVMVAPHLVSARRRAKAVRLRRAAWPIAIDDIISSIRAGVPAEEALLSALQQMPPPLPERSAEVASDIRATGRVDDALRVLARNIDDAIADRLVLAIRVTRSLGTSDVIAVLDDLSAAVRQEVELAGTIAARRSWVSASANVATAAPWITVAALSIRPAAREAYASSTGSVVLASAAVLSWLAHALMRRIGRIEEPARLVMR